MPLRREESEGVLRREGDVRGAEFGVGLPVALTAPTFDGIPVRGQLLTGTAGTYTGAPVLTYQWQRDGGNIGGATSLDYTLVAADDASSIRLVETATTGAGSVSQTTAAAITAPAFLLDAASGWHHAGLSVTNVSLEVTDWANQGSGGVNYDTTQPTGTQRPDLVVNDGNFNNRATIHVDGGDVMPTGAGTHWEMAADGDDLILIALFRMDAGAGIKAAVATDVFTAGGFVLSPALSATCRASVFDTVPTTIRDDASAVTVSTVSSLALVLTGAVGPTADSAELFLNGVSLGTPVTTDLGTISAGGAQEYLIGAGSVASANGLIGNIAEIIQIKQLLTAQEDADLTAYWNDYYAQSFASGVTL